jgi:hypothetical protein
MVRVSGLYRIFCLVILVSAQIVTATHLSPNIPYYPQDFLDQVENGASDKVLKDLIFNVLSGAHNPGAAHDTVGKSCSGGGCYQHTSLGYNQARRILFGELHLQHSPSGYAIFDVYCEHLTTDSDFRSQPPGPGKIPDPAVLNAEHTWPQSRFTGTFSKDMQKSDLHHLFPVMSSANSTRGNFEFGDVVTTVNAPCSKSELGYTSSGGKEKYFEVPAAHKGNVARAIFYFSTRYKLAVSPEEENSLRAWHREDPVDQAERDRNEAIFAKQKDRNPFIDYPELVELIHDF